MSEATEVTIGQRYLWHGPMGQVIDAIYQGGDLDGEVSVYDCDTGQHGIIAGWLIEDIEPAY